jgi:hypothetical protein
MYCNGVHIFYKELNYCYALVISLYVDLLQI